MAELAVFSLASKILSTMASPTFQMAYEKCLSIWEARDDLRKLRVTVETIHAVLLDAEKKQDGSAAVKNWIKRLKDVLYDADDLFDAVATDDMLKQQIVKKKKLSKEVRVHCSMLNPIISRNSVAKKVKAIRKSLVEISSDMASLGFVRCYNSEEEIPTSLRRGQDPGCLVDSIDVIGRYNDKKTIVELILHDESHCSKKDAPFVIAIVGIGGMGKTTLAQLIYNDVKVKKNFGKMWFSCISDVSDDIEVLGKIFQSIYEKQNYSGFTVSQLQTKIRESTEGNKFLLVLDDVWDDDRSRWINRMRLLGSGAIGSKIVVTTRSPTVAMAVGALKTHTHNLDGLSEDDSWNLFQKVAFAPGNENDPKRVELGKEIVKKCRNVPLAIRSIASLLFEKNSIQEWESIRKEDLSKLGQSHEDGIMPVLKLSFDHLPSYLKQCFASCSLYPIDYRIHKMDLIYFWIAQGYIKLENEEQVPEDVGHLYFMYLLRRGFFQEVEKDECHEIKSCKMHDLLVDLARHVAGRESIVLTTSSTSTSICPRHVSVEYHIHDSWIIPAPLLNVDGIRSFMVMNGCSIYGATLDQLFGNFKLLRTLSLRELKIKEVPNCIGELKHLRTIDLSYNKFERLPNSMTNLVNLLSLVLVECDKLSALPANFRKLINLRHLNIDSCDELRYMSHGIGELSCLQYLSHFKVGRERNGVQMSGLDVLAGLRLRGKLDIEFEDGIDNWDDDQSAGWQLPQSLQVLRLHRYPGIRIPRCVNGNLEKLHIRQGGITRFQVEGLPSLRSLIICSYYHLKELIIAQPNFIKELMICDCPKLKLWEEGKSQKGVDWESLPNLSILTVDSVPPQEMLPNSLRQRQALGKLRIDNLVSTPFQISNKLLISFPICNSRFFAMQIKKKDLYVTLQRKRSTFYTLR